MKPAFNYLTQIPGHRFFRTSAVLAAMTISTGGAQDVVDQQSQAYQASMTQSDVKRDAAAIQAQLIELRDQMRQLMPGDVATVDRAIKRMQSLSQDEMDKAIVSLQEASQSKDAHTQLEKIAGAIKSQGATSTSLKEMAVDLQMRETLAGIGSEISALIHREVTVYSEINRLGKIQQMPNELHGNHRERYDVVNEDQKGVSADLKLLGKRIETLSKDLAGDTSNGLVQTAAVAQNQKLNDGADSAATFTASGPFNSATEAQLQVIHTLVAMQQALGSESDALDRLRAMAERLKRAANSQKEVVDAVMQIGERQDLDRNYKTMQSDLNDEVIAVQFELEPLNKQASDVLLPAGDAINKTLENFRRMWEEHMDARMNTQNALKSIAAAYQIIAQQVAQAEASAPQTAAQLAAQLDQLQREVMQAAMQQAQVAQQPQPQPQQQAAMGQRVSNFQQRALPISPEAAATLGAAGASVATSTPEAQKQAAQQLAEAAQQLAKQKAEAQAIAAAQAQIEAAQQQTAQAQKSLENNQTAQAANEMAAAQQNTQNAQANAEAAAPDAGGPLDQAEQQLGEGQQAAAQTQGGEAKAAADAAAASLAQAADGLRQAAGQLPGMGQGGTQVSDMMEDQGPSSADSKGNGGGGKSGDGLAGAGDNGGPVEVLDGLSAHDRDAVAQLQTEKPPREFVPEVQQYYKNIADGAGL